MPPSCTENTYSLRSPRCAGHVNGRDAWPGLDLEALVAGKFVIDTRYEPQGDTAFLRTQELAATRVADVIVQAFSDSSGRVRIDLERSEGVTTRDISVLHITSIGEDPGFPQSLDKFFVTTMPYCQMVDRSESPTGNPARQALSMMCRTSVIDLLETDKNGEGILNHLDQSVRPREGFDAVVVDASVLVKLDSDGISRLMQLSIGALHIAGILVAVPPPYHTGFCSSTRQLDAGYNTFSRYKRSILRACASLGLEYALAEEPIAFDFANDTDGVFNREIFLATHFEKSLMSELAGLSGPVTLHPAEIGEVLRSANAADSFHYKAPIISAHRPVGTSEISALHTVVFGADARVARLGILKLLEQPRDAEHQELTQSIPKAAWGNSEIKAVVEHFRHSRGELWGALYRHCSDPEKVQDATQEAYLRSIKAITTGAQPIRDLKAYLVRVGLNYLRDLARKKSSKEMSFDSGDAVSASERSVEAGLLSLYARKCAGESEGKRQLNARDSSRLKRALVLLLAYGYDFKAKQISNFSRNVFGKDWSVEAIDMALVRARRHFKDFVEEEYPGLIQDFKGFGSTRE